MHALVAGGQKNTDHTNKASENIGERHVGILPKLKLAFLEE